MIESLVRGPVEGAACLILKLKILRKKCLKIYKGDPYLKLEYLKF